MKTTNNKYPYYLHEKISSELFDLLKTSEAFQSEPSAIMASYKFLNNVLNGQISQEGDPTTFYSGDIKNQFGTYASNSYTIFVDALKELNLLNQSPFFTIGFKTKYSTRIGKCREHSLTDFGKQLITSSNKQYFSKMLVDPVVKRKVQFQASKNKSRHPHYDDYFLEYQRDLLMNLSYDGTAIYDILDKDVDSNDDINHLINLKTKHFHQLKRNESDNRLWNPIVAMSSKYRRFLTYKDYAYVATVDARACHPTFLGLLIKQYYNNTNTNNKTISSICHYVGDIVNIECDKWINYTTSTEDFRLNIAKI